MVTATEADTWMSSNALQIKFSTNMTENVLVCGRQVVRKFPRSQTISSALSSAMVFMHLKDAGTGSSFFFGMHTDLFKV